MACSVPHTFDEIKAMIETQIEDKVRQQAIMNLAIKYDNASTTKDDMRKGYEESCYGDDNFLTSGIVYIKLFLNKLFDFFGGKEKIPQDLGIPASDAALQEYCDRNYHQLLPIIAEKVHRDKVRQKKLKVVNARLNFEEVSQHSESKTPSKRRDLKKRLESSQVRSMTGNLEPRRGRSDSPRKKDSKRRTVFKRLEKGVFHRLGDKGKSMSAYSNDSRRRSYHSIHEDTESCYQSSRSRETEFASEKRHNKRASSRRMEPLSGSEDSAGGH
nr:reverse transcriptase domain-containing protein [Tanacetum cinerariifolium]